MANEYSPSSIDGASFPPAYQPHEFTGPEPEAKVDGGKLYTGSCHCGKIKVAIHSKPLDETCEDRLVECNCSICGRVRLEFLTFFSLPNFRLANTWFFW
jgi:hypothetical protein